MQSKQKLPPIFKEAYTISREFKGTDACAPLKCAIDANMMGLTSYMGVSNPVSRSVENIVKNLFTQEVKCQLDGVYISILSKNSLNAYNDLVSQYQNNHIQDYNEFKQKYTKVQEFQSMFMNTLNFKVVTLFGAFNSVISDMKFTLQQGGQHQIAFYNSAIGHITLYNGSGDMKITLQQGAQGDEIADVDAAVFTEISNLQLRNSVDELNFLTNLYARHCSDVTFENPLVENGASSVEVEVS